MNTVDPRTRSKIILDPSNVSSRLSLPQLASSNVLFVLALGAAKEYLLFSDNDVPWAVVRVLGCGAVAVLAWWSATGQSLARKAIEWPTVGFASLLQVLRIISLMLALVRLPYTQVVIISQFSSLWMNHLLRPPSAIRVALILCGLGFSLFASAHYSFENVWTTIPGYAALGLEAFASSILDHTHGVLVPALGQSFATCLTIVGAFICNATLYILNSLLLRSEPPAYHSTLSLLILPVVAAALLYTSPVLSKKLGLSHSAHDVTTSYAVSVGSSFLFSFLAFSQHLTGGDIVTALCLCYGMLPGQHQTRRESPYASISTLARSYLKSILSNPESRKIFYFLVLNMCYMLVQMLYGIWTNSLGLISDAIHMAFDCMAIGVGLIASVMARWAPNERFTYGYGRIETLSGFSNGVFLILISIFIVFEAIERLMNPPDMDTSQLLLVSSLGLAVNLFGMFAMGGHVHGGHSHSHSHGHGHSHANHSEHNTEEDHQHALPSHTQDARSAHEHSDDEECSSPSHSHSEHHHSHSHESEPYHPHADEHHSPHEEHRHSHSDAEHHSHAHSHERSHSHSPTESKHLAAHRHDALHDHSPSPLTPSYHFGHDSHYERHHVDDHAPNLHDHAHVHEPVHEGHSHNMRGVFLHVMADTLGSVGVIISTLLIQYYGWTGFDPIASLFIAVLIAASVIPLVIDTGRVLMLDLSERSTPIESALTELHHVDGVETYSSARFWPKDDSKVIGSIHVRVSPAVSSMDPGGPHSTVQGRYAKVDRIVERVDALLRSKIAGLEELSIQVEAGNGETYVL